VCDSKGKEKYTILSSVVFIFMNSSSISLLPRKMLKVSMASEEAEEETKKLLQESALKIPLKFTFAQQ